MTTPTSQRGFTGRSKSDLFARHCPERRGGLIGLVGLIEPPPDAALLYLFIQQLQPFFRAPNIPLRWL